MSNYPNQRRWKVNKNFFSLLDRPQTVASAVGNKIYQWNYLDKVGKLKEDKKNQYEQIQSFKNSVDYKTRIKQGETFEHGNGIYMDTTKFSGDYADTEQYIANLANDIREQISKNSGNSTTTTGAETTTKVAETVQESTGPASTSSTTNNTTTDGQGGGK